MNATSIPIGVHLDLPAEQYHALPCASASRLRTLWQKTPAHLRVDMLTPKEVTPEMMMGTLCHQRLLEPSKPLPQMVVPPDEYPAPPDCSLVKTKKVAAGDPIKWNWNAKWCQEWRKRKRAEGFLVVTKDEADGIEAACDSVLQHPLAAELLSGAKTEVSLISESEEHGIGVKARLDIVPEGLFLGDCKFTFDASERGFQRNAWDSGFQIQAAFYLDFWNGMCGTDYPKTGFRFIGVEPKPPFAVNVFTVSRELIALGREQYMEALATYARCVKEDRWPGYAPVERTLEAPRWKRREEA